MNDWASESDQAADDERVYSAAFEDESLADSADEESQAATQEALDAERDEIDAAASQVLDYDGPTDNLGEAEDPHAEEREIIGTGLAWWAEENDTPPLDIVVDLANQACGYVGHLRALSEYGLPLNAMPAQITLDHLSGPLVLAGLQILGTLHAHVREDVKAVIKLIVDATPEATDEERQMYADAHEAMGQAQVGLFRSALEARGIEVIDASELLGNDETPDGFDADLN